MEEDVLEYRTRLQRYNGGFEASMPSSTRPQISAQIAMTNQALRVTHHRPYCNEVTRFQQRDPRSQISDVES